MQMSRALHRQAYMVTVPSRMEMPPPSDVKLRPSRSTTPPSTASTRPELGPLSTTVPGCVATIATVRFRRLSVALRR
eukprot:3788545-Prymnesium_polylepis.1